MQILQKISKSVWKLSKKKELCRMTTGKTLIFINTIDMLL